MTPVTLGAGVLLLLIGRRAFWLFVALTGFLAGALLSTEFLPGRGDAVAIAMALAAGVVGAVLALFVQRLAVGVGGFLAGALLGQAVLPLLPGHVPGWAVMIGAGVLGAILLLLLLDATLVILSALLGASVLAQAIPASTAVQTLAFIVLAVAGILFQSRRGKTRKPTPDHRTAERKN